MLEPNLLSTPPDNKGERKRYRRAAQIWKYVFPSRALKDEEKRVIRLALLFYVWGMSNE